VFRRWSSAFMPPGSGEREIRAAARVWGVSVFGEDDEWRGVRIGGVGYDRKLIYDLGV